jgi:hypothetical protein
VILQDEARPLFSPTLEAAFLAGCGRDWFPEQAIQFDDLLGYLNKALRAA